ncbi:MAG: selenium metabolism-associated LysR family transcriptional regulator [Bacillota bacterium]
MDFEQIRAFLNVASLKSFSEAGEKMFISQPSVSVRIKSLEEELGVKLFDRSKAREPSLTEAGKIFIDYAQSIINLQDECREKLSGQREAATGLVYIGSSTVPGSYLLPALLAGFKKVTTSIEFNVNILDTSAVLEGVLNYSYDLGYVGLVKQDDRLEYIPLAKDELVLAVQKGLINKADYRTCVPLDILPSHHLILREKGSATRQLLEKKLNESGYDLNSFAGITYINSLEGIKQAVKEGLGIAFVSKLSVNEMVQAGLVDLHTICGVDLHRSLYLVYHSSRVLGAAARKVKDFTIKEFTK